LCHALLDAVDQPDVKIADRGEVAFVGEIRPLADFERVDRFRHQPVQIRITLPVRMGPQVDRHVIDIDGQIGTVVQIIPAQEILVGFSLPAVLGHDQPRHSLQNFARPRHRARVERFTGNRGLARHARLALGSRTHIRRAGDGYCLLGRLTWNGRKL